MEKLDLFGKGISVNFKGSETYRSKLGGLLSLMLVVFILVTASFRLVTVAEKNNHRDSFSEIFHNITALGALNGSEINFQIGFGFVNKQTNLESQLDETYFIINALPFETDSFKESNSVTWGYPLKYSNCTDFPLTVREERDPILKKFNPKCIESSQV
jgi:hypothetical protein